jgi:hypothetical protein
MFILNQKKKEVKELHEVIISLVVLRSVRRRNHSRAKTRTTMISVRY